MQAQELFHDVGIGVALSSTKQIAFNRPQNVTTLVDIRTVEEREIVAVWDNVALKIGDTQLAYNQWHNIEEGTDMFLYFKDFITSERAKQQNHFVFM